MSTIPHNALRETELYLHTLTQHAPAHALLDVRYRIRGAQLGRLFLSTHTAHAARLLLRIARDTDVYVGCAPRLRRRGTRHDLAPTALLWADCDTRAALAALEAFPIPPSMIIASGSPDHAHAYWPLTTPLPLEQLEQANRTLAHALGADVKCADATRILRPPGTRNFKHRPTQPVHLTHHTKKRYEPAIVLNSLPAPQPSTPDDARKPRDRGDPLLQIPPARYVTVLLGEPVAASGKIHCPFHPDATPSLHVYAAPERGWACFGCDTPDGRPLGGDIYTLASLLWHISTRGRDFHALRGRLDVLFEVKRGCRRPTPCR